MPTVNVRDINMHYQQLGAGPDLMLISGLNCDHSVWLNVFEHFSQHFRVTIFDNRGAGQTTCSDEPYTLEQMADDTSALMDALNIEQAYVIGHSMGGMISQHLALRHPQKIKKLMLYATSAYLDKRCMYFVEQILWLREKYPEDRLLPHRVLGVPFGFGINFFDDPNHAEETLALIDSLPDMISLLGCKRQTKACAEFDTRTQLKDIHVPTLVVSPLEDILIPTDNSTLLANNLPNAQLLEIPHAAHCWHFEQANEFVKKASAFFS